MTQLIPMKSLLTKSLGCLLVSVGLTGCSVFETETTSHVIEPEPAVSPFAVASADNGAIPQAFSLVAADSLGLATFGTEIAAWDSLYTNDSLAEHH